MAPLLRLIRVHQWPKNAFVGAALVFAGAFTEWHNVASTAAAVLLFCLASGAVYVVNDLCDVESDRRHPTKRLRPIASGAISPAAAGWLAAALAVASVGGGLLLSPAFGACVGSYALLHLGYSLWLKHVAVVDTIAVAVGYVLRVVAGAIVIHVNVTPWLLMATFFLTLTIALIKRQQEIRWDTLEGRGAGTRATLMQYTAASVQQMVTISATATIITYALYTFAAHRTPIFMLTLPSVVYTLFRFMLLSDRSDVQAATNYSVHDRGLWMGAVSWLLLTAAAILLTEVS